MRKTIEGVVRTQKAGKAHPCDHCPRPIVKGSLYRRAIMDDDDKVLRFHIPCYVKEFPSEKG